MTRFSLLLAWAFLIAAQGSLFAQGILAPKSPAKIQWVDSPATAVKQHHDTGRMLLIYVTADYCGYCRKMERETWSDPKVTQRVQESVVALKIDAEKHPDLVQRLEIEGLPATLLFDKEGKLVQRLSGYSRTAKVMELLDSIPANLRLRRMQSGGRDKRDYYRAESVSACGSEQQEQRENEGLHHGHFDGGENDKPYPPPIKRSLPCRGTNVPRQVLMNRQS